MSLHSLTYQLGDPFWTTGVEVDLDTASALQQEAAALLVEDTSVAEESTSLLCVCVWLAVAVSRYLRVVCVCELLSLSFGDTHMHPLWLFGAVHTLEYGSEEAWMKTILKDGTLGDKLAAWMLRVQVCPTTTTHHYVPDLSRLHWFPFMSVDAG